MRHHVLAVVLSLAAVSVGATPWLSHGPANGTIRRVAVAPSDRNIIYVTAPDGVFRSRDAGASWVNITGALANPQVIVVNPSDPDRIVALASNGAYRSSDGGDLWQQASGVPSSIIPANLLLDPRNGDVIFAATTASSPSCEGGSVYKSTDGGWTFARVGVFGCIDGFMMDPLQPSRLFVAWSWFDDSGVWRSEDGGQNWQWISALGNPRAPERGSIVGGPDSRRYATRSYYTLITSADGLTWSDVGEPAGIPGGIHVLTIDPVIGRLFVGNRKGAYRSGDGGFHWLPLEGAARDSINDMNYDAASGELLVATDFGLFRSAGYPWNEWTDLGVGNSSMPMAQVVASPSDRTVYALSGRHLFRSTDLGLSWHVLGDPLPDPSYSIAVSAGHEVYAYHGEFHSGDDGMQHIQKLSADGQWKEIRSVRALNGLVADPVGPGTLYSLEYGEIARTRNGGATWEPLWSSPGDSSALLIDPRDPSRLTVLTGGVIAKSVDGGALWSFYYPPDRFRTLDWIVAAPSNPDILYAGVRDGFGTASLARSEDGGATWSAVAGSSSIHTYQSILAVDPRDPDTIFIANYLDGLSRSTDGGHSWERIDGTLPAQDVRSIAIDPAGAFLHAASASRGVWELPLRAEERRRAVNRR